MKAWRRWQDWTNLLLGGWLFVAPWLLGTTSNAASSWNAWPVGTAIVLVSLWALAQSGGVGLEYTRVLLATWLVVAPWVLGFAAATTDATNAWAVGVLVLVLGLWAVLRTQRPTLQGR